VPNIRAFSLKLRKGGKIAEELRSARSTFYFHYRREVNTEKDWGWREGLGLAREKDWGWPARRTGAGPREGTRAGDQEDARCLADGEQRPESLEDS